MGYKILLFKHILFLTKQFIKTKAFAIYMLMMFIILIIIGFAISKTSSNKNAQRDFFVVRLTGKNLPNEIAVEKNTTVEQVLSILEIYNAQSIKKVLKNVKEDVSPNEKITGD